MIGLHEHRGYTRVTSTLHLSSYLAYKETFLSARLLQLPLLINEIQTKTCDSSSHIMKLSLPEHELSFPRRTAIIFNY